MEIGVGDKIRAKGGGHHTFVVLEVRDNDYGTISSGGHRVAVPKADAILVEKCEQSKPPAKGE